MKARTALLLLALSAVASCQRTEAKKDVLPPAAGSALPRPTVPTLAEIERDGGPGAAADDDEGSYRGTGTLHPREEAQLGPKSSGVLTAVTVKEGDLVKKGQLLFRLDAQQAQLAVEQAKAGQASAEVAARTAELDFERVKQLHERGSVSPAAFDQAKARVDGANAAVNQAKAAVSLARKVAGDSAVHSPISGVVTAKHKSVGETVTMMPPTIVLVIQDVSSLELRARLPERALGTLGAGDRIDVTVPAQGERMTVPILRINPAVDFRTRTIEVIAQIDNSAGRLRSGMLAEVVFAAGDAGIARAPQGDGAR
jgi:RND family efflux transporter MFP subunit